MKSVGFPSHAQYLRECQNRSPWWRDAIGLIGRLALNGFFIDWIGFVFRLLLSSHRYHTNLVFVTLGLWHWGTNLHAWITPFVDGAHWPVVLVTIALYLMSYVLLLTLNMLLSF